MTSLNFNSFTKIKKYYVYKYGIYTIRFFKIKNGFCLEVFKEKFKLDNQYFIFDYNDNNLQNFKNYIRALGDTIRMAENYIENFKNK